MKKLKYILGFSGVEMLLSLVVLAGIIVGIIHFTAKQLEPIKGYAAAADAVEYAKAATGFLKTHYMALEDALTDNSDVSNNKIITLSPQILRDDGFLPKNYPDTNKLKQYPCIVVSYGNNQLEAFLYYRSEGDVKSLNNRKLIAGLEHVGGMIGIYQNGMVRGAGKTWSLDSTQTSKLFVAHGTAEPTVGFDQGHFVCNGSQIANNSFVVSFASLLALKNRLPKDDVLSQYPDPRAPLGNIDNDNTMNTDLNMDYNHKEHAIVFQMNPDCVMDPKIPATMQDYDPNNAASDKANKLGCKNRQLSIRNSTDIHGNSEMVVTGFVQGGDKAAYERYNRDNNTNWQRPFVGELKAQSFQPTTPIAVGSKCEEIEIGTMARQAISGDQNDTNNLYVSQVICMRNPLCPIRTSGICYMPANSVTVVYHLPIVKNDSPSINPAAINTAECPAGMAMVDYTDDHKNPPDWGDHCCIRDIFGACRANARAHDYTFDKPIFSYLSNTNPNVNPFKSGVRLGVVHYGYSCDALCACPGGDATRWQPQVTSIICSNDMNRVPIEINQ